jgi:carboxymethylenebutenolidase
VPHVEEIRLRAGRDRSLRAALALPDSDGGRPRPAVLVLHELLGLNDDIRRICARFADNGYVALAPDFLGDDAPLLFCMARFMRGLARGSRGRPYRELQAARRWLASRDDVDERRIHVAGFCIGGGFALLYAAGAEIATVAPFYAAVPDAEQLRGVCPVVASYGGRDRVFGGLGPRLEERLSDVGVAHDVKTYPDAGHSFMNLAAGRLAALARLSPIGVGYHEDAAEDAWGRMLAFFEAHAPAGGAA